MSRPVNMSATRIEMPHSTWTIARDHLLYLTIIAVYCLPYIFRRDLFFRDESRYGGVVKEIIQNDSWFTLTIGDAYYADKPPLFFSLIRLAAEFAGTTAPMVFFIVVAITAFFFVAGSDAFLRAAGFGRRVVRSANLLLLAVPWIAIHMQIVRMDLLFGGLILFSVASYLRGIERAEANFLPLLGGLLAGLAVMVKGPFGFLIPVMAVVAYLIVTRQLRHLVRADLLWSLVLLFLPVLVWLVHLYSNFGDRIFVELFGEQIVERALSGRDSTRAWWLYPLWLGATLMPWLLLAPIFFLKRIRNSVFATLPAHVRVRPSPGLRFIIPYIAAVIILLSLVAQKNIHFLLPAVPALMVLVAIVYWRLDAGAPRIVDWFYAGVAATALISPPALVWAIGFASEKDQASLANYVSASTLTQAAAALSLTAIPLAIAARLRGESRLVAGVAATAIMILAVKAIVLPDLDRVFSPRHIAEQFGRQVPEDQSILVYDVYPGSLSYHFDHRLEHIESAEEMIDRIGGSASPTYVIATNGAWRRDPDMWAGYAKIAEGRLETTDLILLSRSADD